MNPDLKVCSCGERVPSNCVRCRECGAFLHETTREFHEQNFAKDDVAEWLVSYNGQQFGPFPTHALREAFATNFVPQEAMVWKPGLADWIAAHRVVELCEPGKSGDFEVGAGPEVVTAKSESVVDIPIDDLDDAEDHESV